jgi:hypothetical protein
LIFKRGGGTINQELARLQFWAEEKSQLLDGSNGDDGMIREWQDHQAEKRTMAGLLKIGLIVIGGICGIPALLVSLSALGVVHLR